MTKRQKKIFNIIISEYIKTAQPIGSECLADHSSLKVSSATIRNEMAVLADEGYLSQPHISAGRIPTLKGFQYYVENLLVKKRPSVKEKKLLATAMEHNDHEDLLRQLTKQIALVSQELSILTIGSHSFYYTGLSYLFNQPEFTEHEVVYNISQVVDHLDRTMFEIFESIGDETEILIGEGNPFSDFCSVIFTRCKLSSRNEYNLIGILGPIRMDYNKNLGLINYVKDLIAR